MRTILWLTSVVMFLVGIGGCMFGMADDQPGLGLSIFALFVFGALVLIALEGIWGAVDRISSNTEK